MDPESTHRPPISLLRTFAPADIVTLANAACGTGAIFLCITYVAGHEQWALRWVFVLLVLALVFDVFDGALARRSRRQSELGADLDSLSDVISFGVAPAVLGFTLGFRTFLDSVVLVYFVCCGVSRLARFNATAATLSGGTGKVPYYEGTPIPTSLVIVGLLGWLDARGLVDTAFPLGVVHIGTLLFHPFVLVYALSGTLMASASLRIPKP